MNGKYDRKQYSFFLHSYKSIPNVVYFLLFIAACSSYSIIYIKNQQTMLLHGVQGGSGGVLAFWALKQAQMK